MPPPFPPPEADDSTADMALIVRLNGEALALPVRHVHEVIHEIPRTRVPGAPTMAPWLINVRGAVVPLIDVRQRLRMPPRAVDGGRIVVLDLAQGGDMHRLALLADDVEEVVEIDARRIEPLPPRGAPWPAEFVKGAIRRDGDFVLILDTETLFVPAPGPVPLN